MRTFTIIATNRQFGRVTYEMSARIEVQAHSLSDAYKAVRALPQFKSAHLRPEK